MCLRKHHPLLHVNLELLNKKAGAYGQGGNETTSKKANIKVGGRELEGEVKEHERKGKMNSR